MTHANTQWYTLGGLLTDLDSAATLVAARVAAAMPLNSGRARIVLPPDLAVIVSGSIDMRDHALGFVAGRLRHELPSHTWSAKVTDNNIDVEFTADAPQRQPLRLQSPTSQLQSSPRSPHSPQSPHTPRRFPQRPRGTPPPLEFGGWA